MRPIVIERQFTQRVGGLRTTVRKSSERHGRAMFVFFFQAEDGIRDLTVTGVQTCALPILLLLWRVASLIGAWRRTRVIVKSAYEFSFPERAQVIIQRCQAAIGSRRVRLL